MPPVTRHDGARRFRFWRATGISENGVLSRTAAGENGMRPATRSAPAQQATRPREADLIARWGAGAWRGWRLRADDGADYTLVFQGRPGGSAGPDFRDAVLADATGARITGDIELHLNPAAWRAHGHGADPRYNGLALHVTLTAGRGAHTSAGALANGRRAPLVVLAAQRPPGRQPASALVWPCSGFGACPPATRRRILHTAGRARFDERVAAFDAALSGSHALATGSPPGWGVADTTLFIALAEGLGYGRDREALRECGRRLAHGGQPDALLSGAIRLGAVERSRLTGLVALLARWRAMGPLAALMSALQAGAARAGAIGAEQALADELTVAERGAVSPGRARILSINVALPAIFAWTQRLPDTPSMASLGALALAAALEAPGLQSNQITREMTRQLGLPRLPAGALAQQGAHHIWGRFCREKRCEGCPCARPLDAPG